MKSEIKIEFEDSKTIIGFFEKSYKDGKIRSGCESLVIESNIDSFNSLKAINNGIIRLTNRDVIDGFCRFIISSNGNSIELLPISINYIIVDNRWLFF